MTLWLRRFQVSLPALFAKRMVDPTAQRELSFRVLPLDIDENFHMNHSRYFTYMEVARWDIVLRTGFMKAAVKFRWAPIVAAARLQYLRPLRTWEKFAIQTKFLGWDSKWLFFEQIFRAGGRTVAIGHVRGCIRRFNQTLNPTEAFATLGYKLPSPQLPEFILSWQEQDRDAWKSTFDATRAQS